MEALRASPPLLNPQRTKGIYMNHALRIKNGTSTKFFANSIVMADEEYFCVGAEDIVDDTSDGDADDKNTPAMFEHDDEHADEHDNGHDVVTSPTKGGDEAYAHNLVDDEPIVSPPLFGTTREVIPEFANARIAKPISTFTRDDIKRLMFERNFQREKILSALVLVRDYIAEHKLILTGGMAIDAAMRVTGSQLYPDDEIPDYDFFSVQFHSDAYRIATMLVRHGFENVSVIRAMHTSTMRVRVNFVVVADITYLPPDVLARIPTIVYKGLKYVAAHFQMIDQHLMLGHPYINAPREALFNRWKKDLERNALLAAASPLVLPKNTVYDATDEITCAVADTAGHCLGGYAALSIWIELAITDGYKGSAEVQTLLLQIQNHVFHENDLRVTLPSYSRMVFYSDEALVLANKLSKKPLRYYNCFTDKLPQKVTTGPYEIFDNLGRMMGAHKPYTTRGFYIANLQVLLVYFMTCNIWYDPDYIVGVVVARDIFLWASGMYQDEVTSRHLLKYLPTTQTYGKYNWSESYLLARRELFEAQGLMKPDKTLVPQNAYPSKDAPIPREYFDFKPSDSEIYQFDGSVRTAPWKERGPETPA